MLMKIKKECKIIFAALCVGLLFAVGVAAYSYVYSNTVQRDIAENVIRFHVMAHSDDDVDQALKDTVRMDVLAQFAQTLSAGSEIEETRESLIAYLPAIRDYAEKSLRRAGSYLPVQAQISTVHFPTQRYGGMTFPPGTYEAVQITIGDGNGSNWWCLMFPPLCFVDLSTPYVNGNSRRLLYDTLSEDAYYLINYAESNSNTAAIRFRIIEWWLNRR